MTIQKDQVFTAANHDVELTATIDACSWLYSGYGVQLTVKLANGSSGTLNNKPLAFEAATIDDVQQMLSGVRVVECKTCKGPALDPETVSTNRDGQCDKCFMAKLRAELDEATQAESAEVAELDAKYKKQGFTHRVDAWIHPANGDDSQISFWMTNPTVTEIHKVIRKNKSKVLDDYKLVEL